MAPIFLHCLLRHAFPVTPLPSQQHRHSVEVHRLTLDPHQLYVWLPARAAWVTVGHSTTWDRAFVALQYITETYMMQNACLNMFRSCSFAHWLDTQMKHLFIIGTLKRSFFLRKEKKSDLFVFSFTWLHCPWVVFRQYVMMYCQEKTVLLFVWFVVVVLGFWCLFDCL